LSEERDGGGPAPEGNGAADRLPRGDASSQTDRLCAEIRDRARYLAERARGLSSPDGGLARHARARRLEVDAETLADLAEDLLRVAAGLAATAYVPPAHEAGTDPAARPRILVA
jgi:hypothetical protein